MLPASGRWTQETEAEVDVGIEGQGSTVGTESRFPTLLMRVTVYTNSSGSAPFFSSRMDTKLAQGRVPAAEKGEG